MTTMLKKKEKSSKRMIEKYVYEAFEDLDYHFWADLEQHYTSIQEGYSVDVSEILLNVFKMV